MPYIHIKSKSYKTFDEMETGILLRPDVYGEVKNNDELYEAIRRKGKAIIAKFKWSKMEYGDPIELTPEEFETNWRGD